MTIESYKPPALAPPIPASALIAERLLEARWLARRINYRSRDAREFGVSPESAAVGAGGHRWYASPDGGFVRCAAGCGVAAASTVVRAALVPQCGSTPWCRLGEHGITPTWDGDLHCAGWECIYCDLTSEPVAAGSGS